MMISAQTPMTEAKAVTSTPRRDDLIRSHYKLQQGRFFTTVDTRENGIHSASDLLAPMWNHSTWLAGNSDAGGFISETENFHDQNERRPVIYVIEAEARSFESALVATGYEKFDRESWMMRSTESELPASEFSIEPAGDLDEFATIFKSAFNAHSTAYETALRRENKVTSQKHLIARSNDEAVAVGTVGIDGELGCIYNIGTAPRWRGKGAGRAIVEALIDSARAEGCRWVFLQVEAGSGAERLYTKLGFKTLFTRVGYRKAEWSASSGESALSKALGFRGRATGALTSEFASLPSKALSTLEAKGISRQEALHAMWAVLLWRYTSQTDLAFRTRGPNESWQTFRASIRQDEVARRWIKNGFTPGDLNDPEAETAISFGAHKEGPMRLLLLSVTDKIEFTYRTDLFSRDVVQRMANHLTALLESLAQNPEKPIRDLEFLSPVERVQLLNDWSVGPEIRWKGETIVEMLEAQARRTPNAVALMLAETNEPARNQKLTFAALIQQAAQRACALKRAGVTRGASVGVLLPRSLEVVVSLLAIWRAGAIFVPLDSSYPADRTAFMASDSKMQAVITNQTLAPAAPPDVKKVLIDSGEQFEAAEIIPVSADEPAYIIYTSGSTGQPKGVTITHGALAQHIAAMREFYEITSHDRHLHFSPFTFDASFEQLLPPLIAGASVVVRDERLWDVSEFVRNLSAFQLTMVDVPMAYWHQLAQFALTLNASDIPDGLRVIIAGGEAMSAERLVQWQQGPFGARRLVNAYGPTEATITATAFDATEFDPAKASANSIPIGRPLAGRNVYILSDDLKPVPIRVPGQLLIGGPLLAAGYLNRAELTSDRFIKNPFGPGRLYRTGDIARFLDDASIEFLGRADDQIKIRGFRVELGEIECALQEHPGVNEAVVLARNEGVDQKKLVAYVTPKNGKITDRELRGWLRSRLPEYMTPSAILVMEQFPLLNSGKVNRKALPAPTGETTVKTAVAMPKTPLELQLQILFQRVLRRGGIGVDENFFELGGDSLQALELIVQIEKVTGKRLPLETLFQTPTVEKLATELQRATKPDEWSSLVPLQRSGTRAPLFLVHTTPGDVLGYGNFVHHLGADQPCYGFQALGFKDGAIPHDSIEGMAAYYVDVLRKFQPEGPYNIGGWCFGGIVAFEMAQQLRAAGQKISTLLLMETVSVAPEPFNLTYLLQRYKCLLAMSPARWREYLVAKAKYCRQVEVDNRMRFRQAGDKIDEAQRRWLQQWEDVYNANMAALNKYRSKSYDGKVTLFNAIKRDPGIIPDPYYGWRGIARDIEVHEVGGDHDTMLMEPNVTSLAAAVRKVLSKT